MGGTVRPRRHAFHLAVTGLVSALALTGCAYDFGTAAIDPSDCQTVPVADEANQTVRLSGIEDLTVDMIADKTGDPLIILSATDRWTWMAKDGDGCTEEGGPTARTDGIFAIRLSKFREGLDQGLLKASRLSGDEETHPHGIGLHRQGGRANARLFIVDHVSRCRDTSVTHIDYITRVNIGDIVYRSGRPALTLDTPVPIDEPYCSGNDVVGIAPRAFFLSHDSGNCSDVLDAIDTIIDRAAQDLVYFDGDKLHTVAGKFGYVNGLALSHDGKWLYVADTRRHDINVYDVAALKGAAARADQADLPKPVRTIRAKPGIDNLEWGDDGLLYTGAHPDLPRFAAYGKLAPGLVKTSPSAVVQIDPRAGALRLMAYDDGKRFSGSSATIRVEDLLITGAVFHEGLLVCDASKLAKTAELKPLRR